MLYHATRDQAPEGAVYIGRAHDRRGVRFAESPWANPFVGPRLEACALFWRYATERLARDPSWLDPLRQAPGLVCWCWCHDPAFSRRPCHGETLLRLALGWSQDDVDQAYRRRLTVWQPQLWD